MKKIILYAILIPLFVGLFSAANATVVDSLLSLLPKTSGEEKVILLCDICYEIKYQNATIARQYCQQALDLSTGISFKKGEALSLQYLGVSYEGQGEYETALRYQKDALPIFEELQDTLEIANTLNNIGIVLDQKGDYQLSLENYFQALHYYEQLDYKQGIARAFNNIGIVYKKQGNYDKVIEYYKKALAIYSSLKHGFGIAATQSNIGAVYLKKQNYSEVIHYSEKALLGLDTLNIRQFMPYALENMGLAYGHLEDLDKSEQYHQNALELYQEYGNKKESAYTLNNLANIFFKKKEKNKAKSFTQQSLDLAKSIGAKEEMRNANLLLSQLFKEEGAYQQAHDYLQAYVAIKDTLFEIEKTERIAELETRYETAKKEKENLQLKSENEINELTISKKQNQLVGMSIGVLLLLLIAGLLFRQSKLKQREELTKKELEFKEEAILIGIETQEEERKRIAKDLHDGIGQQLSGLKMAWQQLGEKLSNNNLTTAAQLSNLTKVLDEATKDVRNISHQMMPRALQEFGLVPALEGMISQSFSNGVVEFEFTHYKTRHRYHEPIEIGIYRIAQELINNILKHSNATEADIQLIENNQRLILVIEDNGRGFNTHTMKTAGHGLMNIQSRARAIKGQAHFESKPSEGTIVTIRIPIV